MEWAAAPERVRAAAEDWLGGKIAEAESQPTGFSPGVAARLRLADGRRFFVKAASSTPNPDAPNFHRREGRVVQALPAGIPAPRLLWRYDEGEPGWIALLFEDVPGQNPRQPWQAAELERVLAAMQALAAALTPSPLPAADVVTAAQAFGGWINGWRRLLEEPPVTPGLLDDWAAQRLEELAGLEERAPEAAQGDSLQHFDIRADNLLLTAEQVWFVDWPHARVGAPWIDAVLLAPSVTMQGGPPPEELIARFPACQTADPAAITAVVAALAGFLTHRSLQPPPPGLPTLRAFQAAQGKVAREWLRLRAG
jgi:aminoglycoside phosphotransferase (APT) family kinase protein